VGWGRIGMSPAVACVRDFLLKWFCSAYNHYSTVEHHI
jgi:hypothetical protein